MKTKEMFVTGFVMNLICVSVSIVSMNFWSPIILDMGMTEIHPDSRSNHTFARSDVVVN